MVNFRKIMLLGLLLAMAATTQSQTDCAPAGEVSFVCGPVNAEDLVKVPYLDWILASAMLPNTGFYLIDANSGKWQVPRISFKQDMSMYPLCPSAPDLGHLETHGLSIRAGKNNRATIYAVAHGGRESIEIFNVDASGTTPVLTWTGCVVMPEGMPANSVASFSDGSIVATILLMPGKTFGDSLAMRPTGAVVKWSPGATGFTTVGNSSLPGNNGIEVSADDSEIYVVSSGFQTIVVFSNTNPVRQLRSTKQLPITPDNVHMGPNGMLLTAGMKNDVPECGGPPNPRMDLAILSKCPRGSIGIEINPATMATKVLVETKTIPTFSNATMVLTTGKRFWLGTFNGNRIAYGELK